MNIFKTNLRRTVQENIEYKPPEYIYEYLKKPSSTMYYSNNISYVLQNISFISCKYNDSHLLQLLPWQFIFTKIQINAMGTETKRQVILYGLEGIKKAIREHRNTFLSDSTVFEDDFEELRLEYLIRLGKEATVIKEEFYDFMEETLLNLIHEGAEHYFQLKEKNKKYSKEFSEELTKQFWIECLKRSEIPNSYVLWILQRHYLNALQQGNCNEELWDEYKEFKLCPLSYDLDEEQLNPHTIDHCFVLVKHINTLQVVMKETQFLNILCSLIHIIKHIKKELGKGKDIRSIVYMNRVIHMDGTDKKEIIEKTSTIISSLPKLIRIKNNY